MGEPCPNLGAIPRWSVSKENDGGETYYVCQTFGTHSKSQLNPRNACRSETLEEMQAKVFVFAQAAEDHHGDVPL